MVEPLREVLLELMAARTQVRRFGVNVNQAVRELNSTGIAPEWLGNAVALTSRAVDRIDHATAQITQAPSVNGFRALSPATNTPSESSTWHRG